jgi:uncharacterized protein (TIGR03435 family)
MGMALFAALIVSAQQSAAQAFTAAIVKPHDPKLECSGSDLLPGGRFVETCWPLKQLIQEAYDVLPDQLEGGPAWASTELWDITAKAEGIAGQIPLERLRVMLGHLLSDQFLLALRSETKILPVFALVGKRKGRPPDAAFARNAGAPFQFDVQPMAGRPGATLICRKVKMAQLASWLKVFLFAGRPVVDKTGLAGEYDFTLHWAPDPQATAGIEKDAVPAPNASGQALQAALRTQLGLRLESQKAPVTMFLIEHAERPSGQ